MRKQSKIRAAIRIVREVVFLCRKEWNIRSLSTKHIPELSCIAHGEEKGLFRQLVLTNEKTGEDWQDLPQLFEDNAFRRRVLKYAHNIKKGLLSK